LERYWTDPFSVDWEIMSNPTADWEKVGDRFYRKIQLYTAVFDQDLKLDNYIIAGAPYGGALGMVALGITVALW
jgi:hypothetical protein